MASLLPAGNGPNSGGPRGPLSPPYPAQTQGYGGLPAIIPDVPICAIYLILYLAGAAAHMTIFQKNKKQGHLFVMSAMTFGFCMCRLMTFALRIAWSMHPRNVRVAIASNIFVAAGTPLIYVINLIFAHRIIRAQHPRLGWHRALSILARLTIALIVLVLVALITVSVQSSYTLSTNTRRIDRDIQLMGTTFYTFIALLPFPMVLIGLVLPRRIRTERFGKGRFRTKIAVLLTSTFLLTFRAIWGTTTSWLPPVPLTRSTPFYFSKPVFYTIQLLTELLVVYLYAFVRVDLRFYTPTGQRNSYVDLSNTLPTHAAEASTKPERSFSFLQQPYRPSTGATVRIYSEEELFDDTKTLADTLRYSSTSLQLDRANGNWELKRHGMMDANSTIYTPSYYGDEDLSSTHRSSIQRNSLNRSSMQRSSVRFESPPRGSSSRARSNSGSESGRSVRFKTKAEEEPETVPPVPKVSSRWSGAI
ncbi:hypothetical protein EJ08DRAFT_698420 [Tothia fuscella]|uniref:Uncharacterized protein n=1 Tax=Tothia fuscella TaxID=1048955 RepID=A0A9P4TXW5_9PEZI|nr:hypothetical protein EJ08DRAFT_698420 [Tothia fuscella]